MGFSPELVKRSKRCCCKMCGGKIELVKIIHSKYGGEDVALYCKRCKQIEYGTEPKIYYLAKKIIKELEFNYFIEMEEGERNQMLNIAKICDILTWAFKEINLLDEGGIRKQIPMP